MVGAGFRHEAAREGCSDDGLLECGQLGRNADIDEEDTGAIEGVDCAKLDGNWRLTKSAKARGDAFVLLRRGAAEELQRDVPGFGCGPTELVRRGFGAKLTHGSSEIVRCVPG